MPNTDWMNGFTDRDDLTLCDITFPASHDAGLSEAGGGYSGYTIFSGSDDTICHYTDIAGQLAAGSRAFDLRIASKSGTLRAFHGEGLIGSVGGGWGQTASTIFDQVDTFLEAHTGEIVILRISHTSEDCAVHTAIIRAIDDSRLYKRASVNIATVPLSELRGKVIAIFDSGALATVSPLLGTHRLQKYAADKARVGLPICGKYAGQSAGLRKMAYTAITYGNDHGGHTRLENGKHDHLFMVYWQLALNVKTKTTNGQDDDADDIRKLDDDKGTHYNLSYLLNVHRGIARMYHVTHNPKMGKKKKATTDVTTDNRLRYRPNYVNLDFINDISCNKVIAFNTALLPARPVDDSDL